MIGLNLTEELELRGISRRDFLGFCASMASILGLPGATAAIAEAVELLSRRAGALVSGIGGGLSKCGDRHDIGTVNRMAVVPQSGNPRIRCARSFVTGHL